MKKKILITGGAGYIGSILTEHLLEKGHQVTSIDILLHGDHNLFHFCANPNFEFIRGDVREETLMKEWIPAADVIIPLAAIVGAPACSRDPQLARSVNLDSMRMLLKYRRPDQLIVYPTTNSGYGIQAGDVFCTEQTPLAPVSLYGRTKVDAEKAVLDSGNAITLRLATVFGMSPRMRIDLLVNHFVYRAVTDRYIVVFEKDFKRNFVHIRDVADCFLYCLDHSSAMAGRPYNVGLDAANLSKEELALRIKRHIPDFYIHFAEIGSDPDRRNYIVSNQRLREAGFAALRSLDDGIKELIKGYRLLGRQDLRNA